MKKNGFTLIELAIVMTIIALIMAAIVVGESMIRNAQLQAVGGEVARYKQAIIDFRDKYQALPGDFSGATALWGSANNTIPSNAACESIIGTGTQTCDGNGDGRITTQIADNIANEYEQFRAWQHLANADMIDGAYSGVAGSGNAMKAVIGTNVPASKLSGAGYSLISMTLAEATSTGWAAGVGHYYPNINYQHMLQFGTATKYFSTLFPAITPTEASLMDAKYDDGLPSSGIIMGPQKNSPYSPHCTNSNSASGAQYDLTQTGATCSLLFLLGF